MGTPAKVAELSASSLSLNGQLGPIGTEAKKIQMVKQRVHYAHFAWDGSTYRQPKRTCHLSTETQSALQA
jgi:hypothetical protein